MRSASKISAGMVNPIVLKKFNTFWLASEQIEMLTATMQEMKCYLGKTFFVQNPIYRIFHDPNEKLLWLKKRQRADLTPFLSDEIHHLDEINNPYQCGKVMQGGYLHVASFFESFYDYLSQNEYWVQELFDYQKLDTDTLQYKDNQFQHIVFCEGNAVQHNPFFSFIPIKPNKGHQIEVKIEELTLQNVVKKKHFLIPLENGNFYYGGTYDREDTHPEINPLAVQELTEGLSWICNQDFEIVEKNTAFRPTVADRRPIIGKHPQYNNVFVFNGLGARGVLNGAYFSRQLFAFIENGIPIDDEVAIERFL